MTGILWPRDRLETASTLASVETNSVSKGELVICLPEWPARFVEQQRLMMLFGSVVVSLLAVVNGVAGSSADAVSLEILQRVKSLQCYWLLILCDCRAFGIVLEQMVGEAQS